MRTTIKTDGQGRVVLPGATAQQTFRVVQPQAGHYVLILQTAPRRKEPFPPGSLTKYFTAARNRQEETLLAGCALDTP